MRSSVTTSAASTALSMAAVFAWYSSSLPSRTGGYRGTGIAPAHSTPNKHSTNSGQVGSTIATRSPVRTPECHQIRSDGQGALSHAFHRDFLVSLFPVYEEQALLTLRRPGEHVGQSRVLRTYRGRAFHELLLDVSDNQSR